MSNMSKKIKNVFKNKIVLYSVIAVTVIAVGIVVWGAVTDWKFWNVHKKSSSPIPDYPIKHSCHPRFCKKCDISGERCEKGECMEGTENINGYCFKPPTHPCSDKKCAKCSTDGKKCETCASGYILDDNGKCCGEHEKINGTCCDEPCGGECCPKGKVCKQSKRKNATGCCLPGQFLDNDGKCCGKLDDAGNCCDNGTLCGLEGNKYCCGNNGENECVDNVCELECDGESCTIDQNCDVVEGKKKCIDKTCEWDGDTPAYYPQLTYSSQPESQTKCNTNSDCKYDGICEKTGVCQYFPIGVVNKTDSAADVLKNVNFKEDAMNNPYLFLFPSDELNQTYRFSKVKSRISKNTDIKCNNEDCKTVLGEDSKSETIDFNDQTSECLVEEQTETSTSPSSEIICPFKDETGVNSKRCCVNDKGNWSGQVCDKGNECVYDKTKGIGTCLPYNTYTDQNGKICGEDDVEKGLNKIKYKNENGKKIGYCDCGSGNEHLNELNCTIPSECNQNGKVCSGNGKCLRGNDINGKPTYNCACEAYYKGDKCDSVDTELCRSTQKRGGYNGPGPLGFPIWHDPVDYGDIKDVKDGQTCSNVTSACQQDCCDEMKSWGCVKDLKGKPFSIFGNILETTACKKYRDSCP